MTRFRKSTILVFSIFICISLASCTTELEHNGYNNYENDYAEEYNDNDATTDTANESPSNDYISETPQVVFTGEPIHRDNLLWQDDRNRDWEHDIRLFGVMLLRHHPLLNEFDPELTKGIASADYGESVLNNLLQKTAVRNGILADDIDDMRDELREIVIDRINTLIINIPERGDFEVKFGLSEIAALLYDLHTIVDLWNMGTFFPIELIALYDGIYIIGIPKEMGHALYGELIAIGGMDIDEVAERFMRVVPHENEYGLQTTMTFFLAMNELLQYINAIDDSSVADFTIRNMDNEVFDIQLQAMERDAFVDMGEADFIRHGFNTIIHINPYEYFWHEYFANESLLYVRISNFRPTDELFAARSLLMEEIHNWQEQEKIDKLVLDLRQNPGGFWDALWPLDDDFAILSERVRHFYVLIDDDTFSVSVVATANIKHYMDNVTIVGEPSGQLKNFFVGPVGFLPNSGIAYVVSRGTSMQSSSEYITLRPDIFIPLTIYDVINNLDPVMDFIWAGGVNTD